MIPTASNSKSLLTLIFDKGLGKDLLNQITKDFELSGLSINLDKTCTPSDLLNSIHFQIKQLFHTNFNGLLQLLYRVDIDEKYFYDSALQDSEEVLKKITFLILKREWKKVYLRKKYS